MQDHITLTLLQTVSNGEIGRGTRPTNLTQRLLINTLKIGTCQMFILPGQDARMCNDSEAVAALVFVQANGLLLMNLHRSEQQDCRAAGSDQIHFEAT